MSMYHWTLGVVTIKNWDLETVLVITASPPETRANSRCGVTERPTGRHNSFGGVKIPMPVSGSLQRANLRQSSKRRKRTSLTVSTAAPAHVPDPRKQL